MEQPPDFLHLRISGHPAYVSRVLAAGHDGFVVRCPVEEGTPIVPASGTPIDVGWMNDSGSVAWRAGIATHVEACGEAWAFGIQMLDEELVVERRSHPRAHVCLEAEIAAVLGAPPAQATVLDVGAGGMRVRVPDPLTMGDVVQLAIFVPGSEPVRLTARVIRVEGDTCVFAYELFWSGSIERLVEIAFGHAPEPVAEAGGDPAETATTF
jgi:c-di-GMP-binding flagellar brake protein YcgR